VGGVVQRTRDACLDQPVKYGVAEQYKDNFNSTYVLEQLNTKTTS